MKDRVSKCTTTRFRPTWIVDTLWTRMTQFWGTAEAHDKSETTSAARLSDRGGLGPHTHNSGPKSYLQIKQEMVEKMGRPVSLGEVFIRTHAKRDDSFVDKKAQLVAEAFQKKKHVKLTDLETQTSQTSDGTSRIPQLSLQDNNDFFLVSTFTSERGTPYGLGSLEHTLVNENRKYVECSSPTFLDLQKQLAEAHCKIAE